MILDKRQIPYGWPDNGSGYYWKEWVIFALILMGILIFVVFARALGRKRIARNQPLQAWHRWLFPKRFRDGPPYLAPATGTVTYHAAVGPGGFSNQTGLAPPPPSYDPYATNLPPYQPTTKGNGDHPEHEMVYTTQPVNHYADMERPNSSSNHGLRPSNPPVIR